MLEFVRCGGGTSWLDNVGRYYEEEALAVHAAGVPDR